MCTDTSLKIIDLGIKPYREVWSLQHKLVQQVQQGDTEYVLLTEHPAVYTLGKHGKETNMLASARLLQEHNIECIHIERGGDITFHGLGQLVVYPIINLRHHNLGVKDYVHLLEQTVMNTTAEYGLTTMRDPDAPGVWLDSPSRKICALGVKVSHFVTCHGFALNVNTDLKYFGYINPCGFTDRGVTSMAAELHALQDMDRVKEAVARNLTRLLGINFVGIEKKRTFVG